MRLLRPIITVLCVSAIFASSAASQTPPVNCFECNFWAQRCDRVSGTAGWELCGFMSGTCYVGGAECAVV